MPVNKDRLFPRPVHIGPSGLKIFDPDCPDVKEWLSNNWTNGSNPLASSDSGTAMALTLDDDQVCYYQEGTELVKHLVVPSRKIIAILSTSDTVLSRFQFASNIPATRLPIEPPIFYHQERFCPQNLAIQGRTVELAFKLSPDELIRAEEKNQLSFTNLSAISVAYLAQVMQISLRPDMPTWKPYLYSTCNHSPN